MINQGVCMKKLLMTIGILFLLGGHAFASDIELTCNDQSGNAVYKLIISNQNFLVQLTTLENDSSLSNKEAKKLTLQEGESSTKEATYFGKSNTGLNLALIINLEQILTLKDDSIIKVIAYYQLIKKGPLAGYSVLLCRK